MQKEYEKEQKLEHMSEPERVLYKQELAEKQAEHLKHPKVHFPGNKAQLEEVWEKQDNMDPDAFDPKLFYRLHGTTRNVPKVSRVVRKYLILSFDQISTRTASGTSTR